MTPLGPFPTKSSEKSKYPLADSTESGKKTAVRLTRRTKYGDAVLNHEVFPEYAEETLIHEVNCFEPMKTAVEKLCEYEEMGGN